VISSSISPFLTTGKQIHTCNNRINNYLDLSSLRRQCPQLSSQEPPADFAQVLAITTNRIRQCCKKRFGFIVKQRFKNRLSNTLHYYRQTIGLLVNLWIVRVRQAPNKATAFAAFVPVNALSDRVSSDVSCYLLAQFVCVLGKHDGVSH
jgi:hypothetical protein